MRRDEPNGSTAATAPPPPLEPLRALTRLTINAGLLGCEGLPAPATLLAAGPALRNLLVQRPQPCNAWDFAAALSSASPPLLSLTLRNTRFECDDSGSAPALGAALAALPELVYLVFIEALGARRRCSARDVLSPLGRRGALTLLQFDDTDARELFSVLPKLPGLRFLTVDAPCASVTTSVRAARVTAALQALPALAHLSFTEAALTGLAMEAVAAALPSASALQSLDIGIDCLDSVDVAALAAAFPALPHFEALSVDCCELRNKAVAALVSAVTALVSLTLLDLSSNDFDDAALLCLGKSLRGCTALRVLDLSEMPQLSVAGVEGLCAALPWVTTSAATSTTRTAHGRRDEPPLLMRDEAPLPMRARAERGGAVCGSEAAVGEDLR